MLMLQRYFLLFILLLTPWINHAQSIEFVRNEGQWDGPFSYRANSGLGTMYLAGNSFSYVLSDAGNGDLVEKAHHGFLKEPAQLKFHAYRMVFEGANTPEITGSKEQTWYNNYFLGKDKTKWHSGIHPNLALDYGGLYNGIDMHVFSERSNLKYEFKIAPGADPKQIKLRFDGANELQVKDGNLIIHTSVGDVKEIKPYTYQYIDGHEQKVGCRYRLSGNVVSYVLDEYDHTKLLVIDPSVVFATFSGSTADNWGFTATYDAAGNFYAGGLANPIAAGGFFPTTTGAFQISFAGGSTTNGSLYQSDITIMKLNPAGNTKIYATYIGGSDNDQPHSMIVDGNNNLVIAGRTYSTDFPVTAGAYDQTANGLGDIVVVKLNPTGTALVASTYMGGSGEDGTNYDPQEPISGNLKHNYGDDARSEVLVDNANNVYVTASTKSTNFPVTAGAFQSANGGAQDAVVFKLNANLSALTWSTYIGGTADDAGYVLALDGTQSNLYVAGGTQSANFPSIAGGWRAAYQGGSADGYILKFQNSGTYPLLKSTFIGTNDYDQCYGVQVDGDNNVYAMGQTLGGTFPVTAGVYSNPGSSQFVIKLNANLTTNIYSTVFGSGTSTATNISPVAFLVDTCQNVYISGWGGALGFAYPGVGTTNNMPLSTINPPTQSTTDGSDFYFFVLSKNAQSLLYASYFGGTGAVGEHVDGGTSRFDKDGVIYQAICGGCGGSSNFPTTAGSLSTTNASANCNLIAVKIAFNLGAVNAVAQAGPVTRGCPPLTVNFTNTSANAISYVWDFRDGSPTTTTAAPQHTFTTTGVFNVRLIAQNPYGCRATADTTYVTITVDSNRITSNFNYTLLDSCGPYRVSFANSSTYSHTTGASNFTQFTWLFGDNTTYTGTTPPVHTYASGGTYTVTLVMRDTTACNSPDTVRKTFTVNGILVHAAFNLQDSLCVGSGVSFTGSSTNATRVVWTFGDGDTSSAINTIHRYTTAGTYTVSLVAYNPNSCNKFDSVTKTIVVSSLPEANFSFSPVIPVPNTPVQFTNLSLRAVSYDWSFGDGTTATDVNPGHLYRRTGHYTVCLVAKNKEGCTDTVCKGVDADVVTAIDLPTAFTPNGDGSNDRYFPRGGGIEKMTFRIFNRWGQVVFEAEDMPANDPSAGWDGTYKGKEQEMEVYAYVLNVTFIDGTTAQRKGNVTLIR